MSITVASLLVLTALSAFAWTEKPVDQDYHVRMPGTQPAEAVKLEGSGRCLNCHGGYNPSVEPGHNWKGSMMAQASRDPIFWACMTVAAQDSIWALGNANAVDLCERCHFPSGWLGGRSDPPNASAMTGTDFDGLSCDFCHQAYDPFYEDTADGSREGSDWATYWDEAGSLSGSEAGKTLEEDRAISANSTLFSGGKFFSNNRPVYASYTEATSGQFFVSGNGQKRASFADAGAKHKMLYSRFHKSKYFCSTCHDVSNPALANLGWDGLGDLPTEMNPAYSYFHVERTFSEFMASAYGQQGGAPTNAEFQAQGAPDITHAAKCQDCHMRDVPGVAANKNSAIERPAGSTEHPNSGVPLHDLTGGNSWISHILGSLDPDGPIYDPVNRDILVQGPGVLTLDFSQGESPVTNGAALKAGSDRALQQLKLAATIKDLDYDVSTGSLSFKVQNNTGHKLISGFPEGRRMFINIRGYQQGALAYELNPYDYTVGTLVGLAHSHSSPALSTGQVYNDRLVYEVHPESSLTGEEQTFHFVLATGRSKDNRIPPKGFDLAKATTRLAEPVVEHDHDPYTSAEFSGGYDAVNLSVPTALDAVEVNLYYQGTSREYFEFLRDEINGNANTLTLDAQGQNPAGGTETYIVQTDPFFQQLRAWGNTIWDLWAHNHAKGVPGLVPVLMTQAAWGSGGAACAAPVPTLTAVEPGNAVVSLDWTDEHSVDESVAGYNIYYDQAGKAQLVDSVGKVVSYADATVTNGQQYCYKITSRYADCESDYSNILCATPDSPGQLATVSATSLATGVYETSGKGKNKVVSFVVSDTFALGDTVILRALVVDDGGAPVANAVVDLNFVGPEPTPLTSAPSNSDGWAEASWTTQSPNKKGRGGTAPGSYTATVSSVSADGYVWDENAVSTTFSLH